jgi:hypothetical protein
VNIQTRYTDKSKCQLCSQIRTHTVSNQKKTNNVEGRRDGRRERGGGRGAGYEAYEVKNKRQKMRCLLLRRKKKISILYITL